MREKPKNFQIVVAEDCAADATLVRQALKAHGVNCVVRFFHSGQDVMNLITDLDASPSTDCMDLLILDMHLPYYSGDEILNHLRSSEHCAQTPVIVMTGRDSTVAENQATRHAVLVYFRKPSKLDQFMELGLIVQRVLEEKYGRGSVPDACEQKRGAS